MERILMLVMILSSSLLLGQTNGGGGRNETMPSSSNSDVSGSAASTQRTTVQGCLLQGSYGSFVLTDASGARYNIKADRTTLAQMAGEEVLIEGIASPSASVSMPGAMSAANSPEGVSPDLTVFHLERISDVCPQSLGSR